MFFSKEDFIYFCKMVENHSCFEFVQEAILEFENKLYYNATFRDQDNYKISFKIFLKNGEIYWEKPLFYDDEEATESYFNDTMQELYNELINENELVKIFNPL